MRRRIGMRRTSIGGQFAPHTIEMLRSAAWRALTLSARRVLDRLEIELADHGGVDNGKLPVTYDDFVRYGIDRHAVAPAIREAAALGFIEITEVGRAGNAEFRRPNVFRLTYRHTKTDPTDEWKRIGEEQAAEIARTARAATRSISRRSSSPACRPSKPRSTTTSAPAAKTEIQWGKTPQIGGGNPHRKPGIQSGETHTTAHSSETPTTLDISGRGSEDNNAAEGRPAFACSRSAPHSAVASEHAGRPPDHLNEHSPALKASPHLERSVRTHGWALRGSGR
jgi:hypothetical protein